MVCLSAIWSYWTWNPEIIYVEKWKMQVIIKSLARVRSNKDTMCHAYVPFAAVIMWHTHTQNGYKHQQCDRPHYQIAHRWHFNIVHSLTSCSCRVLTQGKRQHIPIGTAWHPLSTLHNPSFSSLSLTHKHTFSPRCPETLNSQIN